MKKKNKYFPGEGTDPKDILNEMKTRRQEDFGWESGKMFGFVYRPGDEAAGLLETAFNMHMYDSRLNPTAFNSLRNMENEIVAMLADLLNGDSKVRGSVTSGGTESILMAMKVAREWKRSHDPDCKPEIIAPVSVHPAFDKAAQYLDIKLIKIPVRDDFRADINKMEEAINESTTMLVASAPGFPHGVVDPVEDIGLLAKKNNLLCHVDACLGGFMLPFVEDLGYRVPKFDFRVKGVTSISADAHKFGYSAKGASVILYKNAELRKHQFFVSTDWPGGIFASSTLQGSRGGGPLATVWAMIKHLGFEGYREIAAEVMLTARLIQKGITHIKGLSVVSNPEMSVFAITSDTYNVYEIGDEMARKGWLLDRLQNPACIHLTISKLQVGKHMEFLQDLEETVLSCKAISSKTEKKSLLETSVAGLSELLPEKSFKNLMSFISGFMKNKNGGQSGSAALYGITSRLNNKRNIREMILSIYDKMYEV